MKQQVLKIAFIRGFTVAVLVSLWSYYKTKEFVWTSFFINLIIFTILNGVFLYLSMKRTQKK